jgi:hypothetical protein
MTGSPRVMPALDAGISHPQAELFGLGVTDGWVNPPLAFPMPAPSRARSSEPDRALAAAPLEPLAGSPRHDELDINFQFS